MQGMHGMQATRTVGPATSHPLNSHGPILLNHTTLSLSVLDSESTAMLLPSILLNPRAYGRTMLYHYLSITPVLSFLTSESTAMLT